MGENIRNAIRTGKINYQNFLKRFLDLGFNNADCINEMIDNSIDANAKNIHIHLVCDTKASIPYYIDIIDDGHGMDEKDFDRCFEMFGDKDNISLQSLGKKGIGGKVALVTLSMLKETLVVSKKKNNELLYSKIQWDKLTEAGDIYVNQANRNVEDFWDNSLLVDKGQGTISRVTLYEEKYNELDELISSEEINERNIYYTVCRNYFRYLNDGLNITFSKIYDENHKTTLKCKPLDPLYYETIEQSIHKNFDILRLYKNPKANQRVELLVKENENWRGYTQNKTCSQKMVTWTEKDISKLEYICEIKLEHSYIMYDDEKDKTDTKKEKHILNKLFPKVRINKDSILNVTGGTHLERNGKETGLLLSPYQKKSGDFDKREYYNQSRHRLMFNCSSSNDDVIDKLFQTQINKSKVDVNEVPKIIKKTVEKLNEEFALKVYEEEKKSEAEKGSSTSSTLNVPLHQTTSNLVGNTVSSNQKTMSVQILSGNNKTPATQSQKTMPITSCIQKQKETPNKILEATSVHLPSPPKPVVNEINLLNTKPETFSTCKPKIQNIKPEDDTKKTHTDTKKENQAALNQTKVIKKTVEVNSTSERTVFDILIKFNNLMNKHNLDDLLKLCSGEHKPELVTTCKCLEDLYKHISGS